MPQAPGAIPPERQRRFDRAVKALADLCAGRERRLSHYKRAPGGSPDPLDLERARWLLVAMGLARGTDGGGAIAALARRGHAVTGGSGQWRLADAVVPLDTPGLLYLGYLLPCRPVRWRRLESVALASDPTMLPERRWCSAHETLQIQTALLADGHDIGWAGGA
jgi:hypothetical protein